MTEVRLLAKKLSKEDIRKYTTVYDRQDARDEAHRRYDAHVQSRLEYEMRQAKATERVQASEAQAQLRLQEQTQRADMLISELRRKLKETTDQAITNTRTAAELEVHLRKEILEAQQRRAELEPTWNMFIAKHNSEEEAREQEQRCRAAVAALPSERRNPGLEDDSNRVELRLSAPADLAAATSHLATPRGADNVLSSALAPGLASTLGMFSPVSTCLKSARDPGPSTATVDSDAARVTEFNRGIRARILPRRHSCVEKSLSRTLCAKPH